MWVGRGRGEKAVSSANISSQGAFRRHCLDNADGGGRGQKAAHGDLEGLSNHRRDVRKIKQHASGFRISGEDGGQQPALAATDIDDCTGSLKS